MNRKTSILSIILLALGCFGLVCSSSGDVQHPGKSGTRHWMQQEVKDTLPGDSVISALRLQKKVPSAQHVQPNLIIPGVVSHALLFEPGTSGDIEVGEASLHVADGSLRSKTTLSVTALTAADLPGIPPEISNVTKGYFAGYRFLPHGSIFDTAVYISMGYDAGLLPPGYTPEDVYTFYFDTSAKKWKPLQRDSIDHLHSRIVSSTHHFTDMINGIINVPESPAPDGFVPVSMQHVEAADPSAGITQIEAPVANNMGDATVSFPFRLPMGRKGLQPELSLEYNSSEGSSWTGYGWSIHIPAVSVDIAWGVPRYLANKESETYILNGTQLTPVAHREEYVDRQAEKRFHARIEKDFSRIIRHGNRPDNYWWEVTDKAGTRNFYGGTPETGLIPGAVSVDKNGNIGYWVLVKTVDVHGNFMHYTYDKPADCGQQLYLSEITYTGFNETEGPYKVSLLRDDPENTFTRKDQPVNARYGFITRDKELLRRINISYRDSMIRSYAMGYREAAFFKTLLDSITVYDETGNVFYSEHFEYYDDVQKGKDYQPYATEKKWTLPDDGLKNPFLNPTNYFFNSVSALGGSGSVGGGGSFATTIGPLDGLLYSKKNTAGGNTNYQHSESTGFLCLVDINGDGMPDKVYKKGSTIYYRPNLMASEGSVMFGAEKVVQGLNEFSLSKTNIFGGGAEAHPLIAFVGYNYDHSKTKSSVYFQDFNGDGLVDVANDGHVLFNHIDNNGNPVFTSSSQQTPNPIIGQSEIDVSILPDPAEEQAMLEAQFPLHDAVRMWQAPFSGTVSLMAPVNRVQVTSSDPHVDTLKVSIQHNGTILWSTYINAGDYSVKDPALPSFSVSRGDHIYFRVQSVFDGSADKVFWDPEFSYSDIQSNDTLPALIDPDHKQVGRFSASDDFILSGDQSIGLPKDGTVEMKVAFSKPVTSDTVRLDVFYFDSLGTSTALYQKKYNPEQTVTNDSIMLSHDVYKNDYIKFKVYATTTIDWSKIRCTDYVEYTYITGEPTAYSADGSPLLSFRSVPDFYPMYNHVITQEFPVILDSVKMSSLGLTPGDTTLQQLSVFPVLHFTNPADPQHAADILFAIKKNKRILARHHYTYDQDTLNNKDTLTIQVQYDDTLAFTYYFNDNILADGVKSSNALLMADSGTAVTENASVFSTIDPAEAIFGKLYRGWGQFDYKGDSIRADSPIDESLLVPPDAGNADAANITDTSGLAGISPGGEVFNVMVPVADRELYMGVDPYVYVTSDSMSSSRRGEKDVLVEPVNVTDASVIPVSREILETTNSVAAGVSVGIGLSAGHTWLNTSILTDMEDMNGDHYPDLMTTDKIQYTGVTGVLKGAPVSHNLGDHAASAEATGITPGGSFPVAKSNNSVSPQPSSSTEGDESSAKEKNTKRNTKSGESQETAEASLGISGEFTMNHDAVDETWIDINGDGLPDKVYADGTVRLNLGYSFAASESWGFDSISGGESRDMGGGLGVNIGDGSIEAGVGISYTKNEDTQTFMDINADGLMDIVINNSTPDLNPGADSRSGRDISVRFNTGSGFAPPVSWPGITALNQGESTGQSASTAITIGIPIIIPPVALKWCVNPGGSVTRGVSCTLTQISDIDGDGFPDVLSSGSENEMYVRSSTIGRTNALKEIDNPLGSTIQLDYKLTPATYQHPGGKLVMASVKVYDGVSGDGVDTTFTTFDYAGGYYDRHEQQFYGYATVTTNDLNTADNDALFRSLVQKYNVSDYYRKGLLLEETILDGAGNKQIGAQHMYALADIHTGEILTENMAKSDRASYFVALTEARNYTYAGADTSQLTTRQTFVYDTLGNISTHTNYASGNANDRYTVTIQYHANAEKYIYNVPALQEVTTTDGLKRKNTTSVNDYGEITHISRTISDHDSATYDMVYDVYGNLTKITRPANYLGERLWYQYGYDSVVHSYVTNVTDAYGYTSSTTYEYKYGNRLTVTDKNNQQMVYRYDTVGRLTSVTGPYDLAEGNPYTIAFAYHPEAKVPYSLARHRQNSNPDLEIYTFIDGLGRTIQVKKNALVIGASDTTENDGYIVSGKELYDAFGRVVGIYHPVFESGIDPSTYTSTADHVSPLVKVYDVLDRIRQVTLPDGSLRKFGYGVKPYKGDPMHVDSLTDALGNVSETYTRANGFKAAAIKVTLAGDLATEFNYNPLGELRSVTDPNGNVTVADYDMLGRKISSDQPDAGLTEYHYDEAGNLLKKITANLRTHIPDGGEINYHYDHERLTEIVYPRSVQNRVNFTYGQPGASFNRAGRIVLVQDGSGGEEFFYSPLGQVVKTIRTVQLGESDMRTFIWSARYDTWNRADTMTYPDGEVVTYTYNKAGRLEKITGEKLGRAYSYLSRVGYDKFGKQVYVKYGNGAVTRYHYDDKLRRLDGISLTTDNHEITNNSYTYDVVGNILEINGNGTPANDLGGSVTQSYTYDDLYRLTGASGSFTGTQDKAEYSLSMQYDNVGNILNKNQEHTLNDENQSPTSYDFTYAYEGSGPDAASAIGARAFSYDEDGNPVYWEDGQSNAYRQLAWDEENRLAMIDDNGYLSEYVYDASGKRVIKSQGGTRGAYVNGAPVGIINHSDNDYTVYLSPYFVFQKNGFTKYYYAGSTRIAGKIGNGDFRNQYLPGVFELTAGNVNYINRQQQLMNGREDFEKQAAQPPGPPTMKGINTDPLISGVAYPDASRPDSTPPRGWPKKPVFAPPGGPPGAPIQWGDDITNNNVDPGFGYVGTGTIVENQQYFYHPDHLGSTQYITDIDGNVVQFVAYMPFGETFVDQHSTWDSPYKFNGKERDNETGLYDYGARYYDPQTSIWLGTDPMAESTPGWSPYVYTFDNPVIYTDPEGMLPLVHYLQNAGQYLNKSFSKVARYKRSKKPAKNYVSQQTTENQSVTGTPSGENNGYAADATTTTQPGRVFWSGGKLAMEAAMEYAEANGMVSLEMTEEGKQMQIKTKNMDWSEAQPLWSELSAKFAREATGTVHVFHNATRGVSVNSVWRTTEYPILKSKNIKIIYHNVF